MSFLAVAWVPVIRESVHALPDEASIAGAKLHWPGGEVIVLGEGARLAIVVDPHDAGASGRAPSDLILEVCATRLKFRSGLGFVEWPYPPEWRVSLARADLVPWWGARQPWIVALAGAGFVVKLFLSWWALALLGAPVAKLLAYFGDRSVTWAGCWRLACAAWLPGSLVMSLAILLYGLEVLALPWVAFAFAAHFVVGAVYLCGAPFKLPRAAALKLPTPANVNPFAKPSHEAAAGGAPPTAPPASS